MNRKASTLLSLGISIALIAVGIWVLCNHQYTMGYGDYTMGYGDGHWIMPDHMMITGGGMGIVILLFWIAALSAVALVVSGVISNLRSSGRRGSEGTTDKKIGLKQRDACAKIDKSRFENMNLICHKNINEHGKGDIL